jgi:hypothetical protein
MIVGAVAALGIITLEMKVRAVEGHMVGASSAASPGSGAASLG